MKVCRWGKDGGPESHVWGFWLVEIKWLFSIVLLRFENGTREAYHSHAFNAVSWVLRGGGLLERFRDGRRPRFHGPGRFSIVTRRTDFHQVESFGRTWVLSFRGPWAARWHEDVGGRLLTLESGRREVAA